MKDEESAREEDTGRWASEEEYRAEISRERKKRCFCLSFATVVIGAVLGGLFVDEGFPNTNKALVVTSSPTTSAVPSTSPTTSFPSASPTTAAPTATASPTFAPLPAVILGGDIIVPDDSDIDADIDIKEYRASFDNTTFFFTATLYKPTADWDATLFMLDDAGIDAVEIKQEGFTVRRVQNRRSLQTGDVVFDGTFIESNGLSLTFAAPVGVFGNLAVAKMFMDTPGDRIPDEGFAEFILRKEFPTRNPTMFPTGAPSVATQPPTGSPAASGAPVVPGAPTVVPAPVEPGTPTVTPGIPTVITGAPVDQGTPTVNPGSPTVITGAPVDPGSPIVITGAPVDPGIPIVTPGSPTVITGAPVDQGTPTVTPGSPTVITGAPVDQGIPPATPGSPTVITGAPVGTPTAVPIIPPFTAPVLVRPGAPTPLPTPPPTMGAPTVSPTLRPTPFPSISPTTAPPTASPTKAPTRLPTPPPTPVPTTTPTAFPTGLQQISRSCLRATDVCGDASNQSTDWEELKCAISEGSLICTIKACNKIFENSQSVGEIYFNNGKNVVKIFRQFVLWNEVRGGSITMVRNGEFNLSGDEKEYRFVFPVEFTEINEFEQVFAVSRKFDGADIFDRFPNPGQQALFFSPNQC